MSTQREKRPKGQTNTPNTGSELTYDTRVPKLDGQQQAGITVKTLKLERGGRPKKEPLLKQKERPDQEAGGITQGGGESRRGLPGQEARRLRERTIQRA